MSQESHQSLASLGDNYHIEVATNPNCSVSEMSDPSRNFWNGGNPYFPDLEAIQDETSRPSSSRTSNKSAPTALVTAPDYGSASNSVAGTLQFPTRQRGGRNDNERKPGFPCKACLIALVVIVALVAGAIVTVQVVGNNGSESPLLGFPDQQQTAEPINGPTSPTDSSEPSLATSSFPPSVQLEETEAPSPLPTPAPTQATLNPVPALESRRSTLEDVAQRGLNCGVADLPGRATRDPFTQEFKGFSVDLCRAIAAAAVGSPDAVTLVEVSSENRFELLQAGTVDLLASSDTITMQRDVYEPSAGAGLSFSIPHLYTGTLLAGSQADIECISNQDFESHNCTGINVCVISGTTQAQLLEELSEFEQGRFNTVFAPSLALLFDRLRQGFCSVIVGDQLDIAESNARQFGYTGDYHVQSEDLLVREPLALATREDDSQWSDFVSWVVEGLIRAEELNVGQGISNAMPTTDVFGGPFQNMFQRAIAAVGNYGEMYERNLGAILPRPSINRINDGSSGLILPFPFGNLTVDGPDPVPGSKIAEIQKRGFLLCGISRRPIFAYLQNGEFAGMDVDFCKAIAAAIFDGRTRGTVRYENLEVSERFQALADGTVDVLSRITTANLEREVRESSTGIGFDFSAPNFYDGLLFAGTSRFVGCADRFDFSSSTCRDLTICVAAGTTFEAVLRQFGVPESNLVLLQAGDILGEGLSSGSCNVIAGGVSDVSATNVRNAGYSGEYSTGNKVLSKDPLALVTLPDDPQWSAFVFWIVQAIFFADEEGISSSTAGFSLPQTNLFGPSNHRMLRDAVAAVGSYDEIYNRHVRPELGPRSGLNQRNKAPLGPQHNARPGIG